MKFEIVCDSSADLPRETTNRAGVRVVPFYVSMDGQNYLREGVDISIQDFYTTMVEHSDCFPKTSMPSVQDYVDAMQPFVKAGRPVLCICLTSKFSGSFQSAQNARLTLLEEYPDADIHVMDSQLVTALEGLFVQEAVRLRDLDLALCEAVPLLEEIRKTGHIFFTTNDLKYLEHGGRLGKVASIAGSVLNLKPVLHFFGETGDLGTTQVCRGRKKSLQRVIRDFAQFVKDENIDLDQYLCITGIGLPPPEYDEFREDLEICLDTVKKHPDDRGSAQIGATIGVHTGPWPMGMGMLKKANA